MRRPNSAARPASGPACKRSSWPSKAIPPRTSPTLWASAAASFRPGWRRTTAVAWRRCRTAPIPVGHRSCPGPRRAASWSGSMPRRAPRMGSVPCGAPTSAASWSRSSTRATASMGVYKLLHRLEYSSLMPRPQHEEADAELQAIFKEVVLDQIQAIEEAHPDEEVQVWNQDEARFGQQGTRTRVRARKGSRPRRVRQNGRESLYVLTAVCAASGAAMGLIMPELNAAVVNLFLEQFARQLAPGVHAVLLWDNAGYHVSKDLVVPSNVSLIGLLPYSPELNPVENLWHYLRAHYWSHGVYPDYDTLLAVATETWRKVCLDPEKVRSICAVPYLERRK